MSTDLVERRRNLLKLRSLGLSLPEVVKELSTQYHVSARIIYYDWARRKDWIEGVLGTKDPAAFFLEILSNHRELYRLTSLEYLKTEQDTARIGALRLLRDLNRDFEEMILTKSLIERVERLEARRVER